MLPDTVPEWLFWLVSSVAVGTVSNLAAERVRAVFSKASSTRAARRAEREEREREIDERTISWVQEDARNEALFIARIREIRVGISLVWLACVVAGVVLEQWISDVTTLPLTLTFSTVLLGVALGYKSGGLLAAHRRMARLLRLAIDVRLPAGGPVFLGRDENTLASVEPANEIARGDSPAINR